MLLCYMQMLIENIWIINCCGYCLWRISSYGRVFSLSFHVFGGSVWEGTVKDSMYISSLNIVIEFSRTLWTVNLFYFFRYHQKADINNLKYNPIKCSLVSVLKKCRSSGSNWFSSGWFLFSGVTLGVLLFDGRNLFSSLRALEYVKTKNMYKCHGLLLVDI